MEWYYAKQGRQEGPVDLANLQGMLQSGQLAPSDLIWKEGMAEWLPAEKVPEVTGSAGAPPEATTSIGPTGAAPGVSPAAAPQGVPPGVPQGVPPGSPMGVPTSPPTSPLAIISMVVGIIGVIMCWCGFNGVLSIAAVICGHLALNQIKKSPVPIGGEGMAKAGLITGYVGLGLQVVMIILMIIGQASGGGSPSYSYP